MERKKVRLSDIAEKLNVSIVTVSKALADKEGVGDELKQKIKDLADKMGYKVHKDSLKQLNSSTGNIGIIIPSRFFSQDYSFYWYLFNYLSKELLTRNYYTIMELLSDENEENLILPRMLDDKKIDGIIILGQTTEAYINNLNSVYKNFILLDFYLKKQIYDSVSNDDFFCSYMMTNHVIECGHKNIRFVGNFDATTSIRDRFMGFQAAMYENHLPVSLDQIIPDRDSKGSKITIPIPFENLPTAFVCNCDETAAIVISQLEEKGYKVPEDISVTGFDNYLPRQKPSVGLTTIYINPEDTAKIAADLIINKITGKPYTKGRHLVCGELIVRESVKTL